MTLAISLLGALVSLLLFVPVVSFLLATITLIVHWSFWRTQSKELATAIYKGRVSHSRFQPVRHAFSYPLFMCFMDLDDDPVLFGSSGKLWPLNWLVTFRPKDHLKNGEGESSDGSTSRTSPLSAVQLKGRVLRLVRERANEKVINFIESNYKVCLLTHLCYYGYCFNPVSFYYVMKQSSDNEWTTVAIVAEVSNTPWNEMYCYVLHPESVDVSKVQAGRTMSSEISPWTSVNYIFDKNFHVSPFMEMSHVYDWSFWDINLRSPHLAISTTMLKKPDNITFFNAFFKISRQSIHPYRLCWEMVRYPIYCALIQIWIHVEAFWLFVKGVEFVPHPEGAETTASRIIGSAMTPLFALKDWISQKTTTTKKTN